ncbi:MAG: MBL fold metallo-hydrolase [Acidobacteriota bacterium]
MNKLKSPQSAKHPTSEADGFSRRGFLAGAGSCGAHLLWLSATGSVTRQVFAAESGNKILAEEPWGRLEQLVDGVWAIISTPLEANDWTTLCNGGIIAGQNGVLAVESFASAEGARWAAEQARELTGRWPTDVVVSHYHGDHANGVTGFAHDGDKPRIWMTEATRETLLEDRGQNSGRGDESARTALYESASIIDAEAGETIDLGGRKVRLEPRAGHTESDVTIEVEDPSVVFYGDLLWNRMFPNFRDTTPSVLEKNIRATMRERETFYVPGHGPMADVADVEAMLAVLAEVEAAARKTFGTDMTADETGKLFKLPESMGEWTRFSDNYYQVAMGAWHKELALARKQNPSQSAKESDPET